MAKRARPVLEGNQGRVIQEREPEEPEVNVAPEIAGGAIGGVIGRATNEAIVGAIEAKKQRPPSG